jgi:EmrB/QacA subfamily drug resistance transporter
MATKPDAEPAAPAAVVRPHVPLAVVVAIAAVAGFMVVMDSSIVNVALPAMRRDLHLSASGQQWVVDSYLLTLGGFLLLGARVADLYGRKITLQGGLVVFILASLAGGLAVSGPMLLAARAVQGVGGAVLSPAGLGLIIASHHHPPARAKAMSLYSAAASLAAVAGVLIGGVLTQEATWRWVMFVNVPIGAGLFLAVTATLAPSAGQASGARLDLGGAAAITIGAAALIYGLSEADVDGWGSATVVASLAVAAALVAGFALIETRAAQPLVRLSVFRLRNVDVGNLVVACLGITLIASTFFVSLILQTDLGYSALRAGAAMAPLGAALAASSIGSARLVATFGARRVLIAGGVTGAAGFAWLAAMPSQPDYAAHVLGPLLVIGAGLGLMIMPSIRAAASGIPPHEAGLAAGLFNMARQLGAAIGLAALVTLASSLTHQLPGHAAGIAQLHGYRGALLATGGVSALAATASLLLHRDPT